MSEWAMDRSQPSSITLDIKLPSSSLVSQPPSTNDFEPFKLQITIQIPNFRNSAQSIQTAVPSIELIPTPLVSSPARDEAQQRELELRDALNKRKPIQNSTIIAPRSGKLPTPAPTSQSESPVEDGLVDDSPDATCQNSVIGHQRMHHDLTVDADSSYLRHRHPSTSGPPEWREEDASLRVNNLPQRDSQSGFERSPPAPCTPPGSPPRSHPLSTASRRSYSRSSERGRSRSRDSFRTRDCSPVSQGYLSPRRLEDQPSNARYSASRSDCDGPYDPEGSKESQDHPVTVSLQDRMKEGPKDSQSKRAYRICPFYHGNPNDKHPPYKPHPGYQSDEFAEAVSIFANGSRLPKRLVKTGVVVNYRMQAEGLSPTKSHSSGNTSERLPKGNRKRSHDQFTLQSSNYGQQLKKRKFDSAQPRRNSYTHPGRAPTPPGAYGYPPDHSSTQPGGYRSPYKGASSNNPPYYLENGYYHQRSYSDYQRPSSANDW